MSTATGQQEFFSSLIFQPRTEERSGVPDYRSPRPSRSPSATPAYGRTTYFREGSTRRRGSTPPVDQATPPPPTESLWLSKSPSGLETQQREFPPTQAATSSAAPAQVPESVQVQEDTWVTVFGFQPGDIQAVLREFTKCGDITNFGSGRNDAVNWVHVHYANKYQAQRALQRNGDLLSGHLMVGVQRLDVRHRNTAAAMFAGRQQTALPSTPSALPVRPYRIDAPQAPDLFPQPSQSTWARVNEFIFGL